VARVAAVVTRVTAEWLEHLLCDYRQVGKVAKLVCE
jgi:hypothetical protein